MPPHTPSQARRPPRDGASAPPLRPRPLRLHHAVHLALAPALDLDRHLRRHRTRGATPEAAASPPPPTGPGRTSANVPTSVRTTVNATPARIAVDGVVTLRRAPAMDPLTAYPAPTAAYISE
ncbi:hypothetical protein [Streptomyces alboflavus]|uniref:hypothetical protein n=1 Tax=Streptomyces alboflavus TaxID=67267 RepID=UPI0013312895